MSESSSSSNSSNDNIIDQHTLSDYEWEAKMDEQSEALQNLVAQRIRERVNRNIQRPIPPPRRRRRNIERNREEGHNQLYNDYFMDPVYPEDLFRRRFRMHKHLFMRIVNAISANDHFFQQRPGGNGRLSFSTLQRCTTALRVLAYGTSTDSVDEYLRMSDTSVRDSLKSFVEGSIDCMHWEWKNCPTGWAGQYSGRSGKPTVVLEVVASYDLWIWHALLSTPGSLNDINVLQRSPLFDEVLEESAPTVNYTVNGTKYNIGYYLADGIYPAWATFVKTINAPQIQKHKLFAARQESCRKDVERAFGVLQARFSFIKRPCLLWDRTMMGKVLMACIIMHNMIVEDERETYLNYEHIIAEFIEDLKYL
ncbi:uncharacterized protein LOC141617065 [Silene latifolia]|uniref:uncharacterized protein LOC141617065 n=1 Tax=Silene latifolia TaxID=37657 RepID=UPI003D779B7A